ncbi:MAG: hypothetical protein AB8I08_40395 [Sandaracinaceae bacterium]
MPRWLKVTLVWGLALVACDQLLLLTPLGRPVQNMRGMVEPLNAEEPPYYRVRPRLSTI